MTEQFIHPTAEVDPAAKLCENTIIGAYCQVGSEVTTSVNVRIEKGTRIFGKVFLGPSVWIGPSVTLIGPMEIKEDVKISENAVIGVEIASSSSLECGLIGKGACIGDHSVVLGKLSIGEFAYVRPGACLKGDLPHHAVAAGDPAGLVDFICECGRSYSLRLLPTGLCICKCASCGSNYRIGQRELQRRGYYLLPNQQAGEKLPHWAEM